MILSVSFQLEVFFTTIITGITIGFFYDVLKIFRLLILHNRFFIDLEDIVFWAVMSVLVFFISLYQADGEIRMYFLIGLFLGLTFYFGLISRVFMNHTQYIINKIKNLINKILDLFKKLFKNIKDSIRDRLKKPILKIKNKVTKNNKESGDKIEK
ncbi:MAG: spore cortex biosynthesis protein YabQ [bacterium]